MRKVDLIALLIFPILATTHGSAAEAPRPQDEATVNACLKASSDAPEPCIGTLYKTCTEAPGGSSTAGMGQCAAREIAVWDAMLNRAYQSLLAGPLGTVDAKPENRPPETRRASVVKGAELIRDMQRNWLSFRARKCDVEAMQYEGGSASRVVYGDCTMRETARQALWLRGLVEDLASR
jgi:uncharacterized protein YecT (DUF1311 family)